MRFFWNQETRYPWHTEIGLSTPASHATCCTVTTRMSSTKWVNLLNFEGEITWALHWLWLPWGWCPKEGIIRTFLGNEVEMWNWPILQPMLNWKAQLSCCPLPWTLRLHQMKVHRSQSRALIVFLCVPNMKNSTKFRWDGWQLPDV